MTKSSGRVGVTISRRALLAGAGVGVFMGPWKHVRVYAAATDKPIKIGLTHDASGQFGASGQSERAWRGRDRRSRRPDSVRRRATRFAQPRFARDAARTRWR